MNDFTPETQLHTERNVPNPEIKAGVSGLASTKHPEGSQDSALILTDTESPLKVFGVFDGMGGYKGGAEASSLAQKVISERINGGNVDPNLSLDQASGLVKSTLLEAHDAVKQAAIGEFRDMGTTASLSVVWEGKNGERKLVYGNVGDSRIYVRRGDKLIQLTIDDNLAEIGKPNTLTQVIGQGDIDPKMRSFDLQSGDQIITVSDGIVDALEGGLEAAFHEALSKGLSPDKAAEFITTRARERSLAGAKMDDQTTLVAEIGGNQTQAGNMIESPIFKKEEPYRLPNGTMVNVKRSDGTIEDGWFVSGRTENGNVIVKNLNGQVKTPTPDQLDSINPTIENAKTWDQLAFSINQLPDDVKGRKDTFSKDDLIRLIEGVKSGDREITAITRTLGLRDKVRELLDLQDTRKNLGTMVVPSS